MATFATSFALGVEKTESGFAQRKMDYFNHFKSCLLNYSKMILFTADNIPSKHIQDLRLQLRSSDPRQPALVVMGKNTLMRRVVKDMSAAPSSSMHSLSKLLPLIEGNVGFVFTNTQDPLSIARVLSSQVTTASAKPGSFAPCDVTLPRGLTNLGPDKTAFFRAVGINTRISKNQVELINPVTVLKEGDRVSVSASELLDLLKIRPFEYRINVKAIFENGEVQQLSKSDGISSVLLQSEEEAQKSVQDLMLRGFGSILGLISSLALTDLIPAHLLPRAVDTTGDPPATTTTTATTPKVVDEETDVDVIGDLFGMGGEDDDVPVRKETKEVKKPEEKKKKL